MDKKEFNKYCAEVMGWEKQEDCIHPLQFQESYHDSSVVCRKCNCIIKQFGKDIIPPSRLSMMPVLPERNPYDNANQRHEVFDKLWKLLTNFENASDFLRQTDNSGIDYAERELIWSTKESQ